MFVPRLEWPNSNTTFQECMVISDLGWQPFELLGLVRQKREANEGTSKLL